jgi:hypothetical protein
MLANSLTRLSSSSRRAIAASLVLIAVIAIYNWVVAPHTGQLLAAQRYEDTLDQIARRNEAIEKTIEAKKQQLQELGESAGRLYSALFTPEKARGFFSDLQIMAEQAGCEVQAINFVAGERRPGATSGEGAGVIAQKAIISVVGTYGNIIGLIERLQARTEKVWVDSVGMEVFEHSSARPRGNITMTIYTVQDKESDL